MTFPDGRQRYVICLEPGRIQAASAHFRGPFYRRLKCIYRSRGFQLGNWMADPPTRPLDAGRSHASCVGFYWEENETGGGFLINRY